MKYESLVSSYSLRVSRRTKFNFDDQPEKKRKNHKLRSKKSLRCQPVSLPSCSSTEFDESYESDNKTVGTSQPQQPQSAVEVLT
jgi:hypothetical protein